MHCFAHPAMFGIKKTKKQKKKGLKVDQNPPEFTNWICNAEQMGRIKLQDYHSRLWILNSYFFWDSSWRMKHEGIALINNISLVLSDGKGYAGFTHDYDRLLYNSGLNNTHSSSTLSPCYISHTVCLSFGLCPSLAYLLTLSLTGKHIYRWICM